MPTDASIPVDHVRHVLATVATPPMLATHRVVGVGVDVVDLAAFEHSIAVGGQRWLGKVFTLAERGYAEGQPGRYAARFAGKEAVVKSLGVGFRDGIGPRSVEIGCDGAGRPRVQLHDTAGQLARSLGVSDVLISLTRDGGVAAAAAWALAER